MELQCDGAEHLLLLAYKDTGEQGCHDFNLGLMCCLPKKPAGTHETLGEYFGPEDTRPLAIVNTDNRLIASAYRLAWEPMLEKWISRYQMGVFERQVHADECYRDR